MMKKFLVAILAVAAVATACKKEDPEGGSSANVPTISLTLSATQPQTRTYIEYAAPNWVPRWQKGDSLTVTYLQDGDYAADCGFGNKSEDGEIGLFGGSVKLGNGTHTIYAFYPRRMKVSRSGQYYRFEVPAEQLVPKLSSFDPYSDLLVSSGTSLTIAGGALKEAEPLRFSRVLAIARLVVQDATGGAKLSGKKIKSLSLQVPGAVLSGRVIVDLTKGTISGWEGSYNRDYVGVKYEGSDWAADGQTGAFVILNPTKFAAGGNLKAEIALDDESIAVSRTAPIAQEINFEPNKINTLVIKVEDADIKSTIWHFSGGQGTEADPFQIATPRDLDSLSIYTNGSKASEFVSSFYLQTANIDMAGKAFQPIAESGVFKGSYDGGGHSVSNLKPATAANKPSGFIAKADGVSLRNLNLVDAFVDGKYVYCGGLIGYASNSVIENCTVSGQVRQYVSGLTVGEANAGFSGGLVGWMDKTRISNCTLDGDATFYGKFSGGIVGYAKDSTVESCRVAMGRTVNVYYHWAGGVVGKAEGAQTLIKGCSFEGNLTNVGYILGGIVGQVMGGRVEECVFGSYGKMGSDKYFVGGIVGAAVPTSELVIDKCACYGVVSGQYSVGAIVGYTGFLSSTLKVSSATKPITISNCASIGAQVTATGNNGGSNSYSLVTGLCGWTHGSSVTTIKGCYAAPSLVQTISVGNRGALGGISGYQNCTGTTVYENCYSTITPPIVLNRGERVTDVSGTCFYGAIYARCTQPTTVRNCFWDEAMKQIGPAEGNTTESGNQALTTAQLSDGTLLAKLQATASGTTWIAGSDGLPTIEGLPADPNVKPKAAKRLSVIGDSISTFKGWIPSGYSAHYPATDGTLTLVNETYWYRLAHDYLKSCEIDTNIAFSGSTVTNTTDTNYAARYGSATNAWFKKDFTTRFAECGGCGRPDIILIHGGTNDWAHNADPLAPGVAIRNDASNIYGGSAPSASIMQSIYATADAAKTRSAINALPDGTFCEAYVKLLCQIRERYPQCKVVCIIGDYLSQSIEESVLQIADHYGAKTVNLFRVNGFNDLGGYTPSTLSNKGKQPNMPKHDYSGDLGGCHPGSQAMKFIAEKIYAELGTWLEE